MTVSTSLTDLPRIVGRSGQATTVQTGRVAQAPGSEFSSRAAAEAYIGKVCFKQGPPMLIGAELEWLTAQGEPSASAPRPQLTVLADALGPHAPQSISPDSPAHPLPGGSRVTIEPGGQIELSSAPFGTAAELCERLRTDTVRLRELLDSRDIHTFSASADPARGPQRLLQLPRYRAMERSFAGIGPFGALMMCNTAATQVSVDAGADEADIAARLTALYAIGPALLAAFACSPILSGAPPGSWASQRMRTWLRLDYLRTRPPVHNWADPVAGYAQWALDVPLLCVRPNSSLSAEPGDNGAAGGSDASAAANGSDVSAATIGSGGSGSDRTTRAGGSHGSSNVVGAVGSFGGATAHRPSSGAADWSAPPGATFADWLCGALDDEIDRRPDQSDLDYHLTTVFPPVRASGHLEVRYLDAQPGDTWTVPVHAIDALVSTPAVVAEATALASSTAGLWSEAARYGLADPEIRAAAVALLDLATAHAATPSAAAELAAAAARCRQGLAPTADSTSGSRA
ncbi:ergothioneine biosynthesis glutamate--cysteine ligase EgtA [Nocardia sp. SYP-A9097]|uniref:glutamate-cysteine ligase family protein n=1 Tax=Nocardia sp. SYP-A9097 TaxID=2663237 RepID=UPI00129A5F9E|nr:glutamate-cysteine ligase family protein [Nocardia sp. SYP-A9097]MRH86807.1 ergothioneine biosynthesis glutamate--cysteine ligase EgtA [Nocardia sp. SYP-A9097]